jgi:hypothetical protein
MASQQAGLIDRIFNSSIGLPQQVLWRILRALKEDDVDLFSEKGLLDFANVPLLGWFDDHKEDVMPDYMAETMFGIKPGDTGWKSEIGAAVLSDPLTYLTGGLSTLGKGVKGINQAAKMSSITRIVKAASKAEGRFDLPIPTPAIGDVARRNLKQYQGAKPSQKPRTFSSTEDFVSTLTGQDMLGVIEHARRNVRGSPHKYKNAGSQLRGLNKAEKLIGNLSAEQMSRPVRELLKSEGHRKLALGLPGLATLGARIHIPGEHQSWWQLLKAGKQRAGDSAVSSYLTRTVAGIPVVGRFLKEASAPLRQFAGGWAVGAEARTAIREARKAYTEKDFNTIRHWANADTGGGDISHQIALRTPDKIMDTFEERLRALKPGEPIETAFMKTMRGISNSDDTMEQIWARLSGVDTANAAGVKIPTTPEGFRNQLRKKLNNAAAQGEQARELIRSGQYDATLSFLDVDAKAAKLLDQRGELSSLTEPLAEATFNAGVSARKLVNNIFHTGQETRHAQEAMQKFLVNTSQGAEQVTQFAKMFYQVQKQILKDPAMKTWSSDDVETVMGYMAELTTHHVELVESLKLSRVNSTNALQVAQGWQDYTERHSQIMSTMKRLLTSKDVKDETTQRLTDVLNRNVFEFLPRLEEQGISATFDRMLELGKNAAIKVFTPQQKFRMRRRYNKHSLQGGRFQDTPVGELTDDQLLQSLDDIRNNSRNRRKYTPQEILDYANNSDAASDLRTFRKNNNLTMEEALEAFNRTGRGQARRITRSSSPTRYPVWAASRKKWTQPQASNALTHFGLEIEAIEGGYRVVPSQGARLEASVLELTDFERAGWSFKTISEAMQKSRQWLDSDVSSKWRASFGTDVAAMTPEQLKKITTLTHQDIPVGKLAALRKELSPEARKILRGSGTLFDERELAAWSGVKPAAIMPAYEELAKIGNAIDYRYLNQAHKQRLFTAENRLKEPNILGETRPGKELDMRFEAANVPRLEPQKPSPVEFQRAENLFLDDLTETAGLVQSPLVRKQLSDWAQAYGSASINLKEMVKWLNMHKHKDVVPDIPPEILESISESLTMMGGEINKMVLANMPEPLTKMLQGMRHVSKNIFVAARRSGQYVPGSPIGYVGRYFNTASSQVVARVLGSMDHDELGNQILMRLTDKSSSHFARHHDSMSIETLNDVHESLRQIIAGQQPKHLADLPEEVLQGGGAGTPMRQWFNDLDEIMQKEGLVVKGVRKKLKWTGKRLVEDPILNTLTRLANANNNDSLEKYFEAFLKAGTTADGDILAFGGKVVAVLDDAGNPIKPAYMSDEVVYKDLPEGRRQATVTRQAKFLKAGKPAYVLVEASDGRQLKIPAAMDMETGFGFLQLGKPSTNLGDVLPTAAQSFVRASVRSDLDRKFSKASDMMQVPYGTSGNIYDLVGQHVVYGAKNIILGATKTAAQTIQVTPAAWRNFDSINYMIKSFQTVFRVPFHVANLASGVFQASMAGVSPKNLIVSYIDTFKLLWGDTNFIRHADIMPDLMGIPASEFRGGIRMARLTAMNAVKRGGAVMDQATAKEFQAYGIDRVPDMFLPLPDGGELAMSDFLREAADRGLYGTFASSLSRGSRTVPDILVKLKMEALDDKEVHRAGHRGLAKLIRTFGGEPGELREVSEAINRTSTALGLVREGHSLGRAIEITKNAHVPYERLTPTERNVLKRVFLYYSFPRHYMPWAWSKFMEDPSKLSVLANTIKQKKLISTDEGRAHLKLGDYRLDVGRLNANMEATMMIGAFADNLALPIGRGVGMGDSHMHPYDPNVMTNQITDAGLTSFGGLASILGGGVRFIPQGGRTGMAKPDTWNDARTAIWPIKLALIAAKSAGADFGLPSKEEQSPYVDYTPMEKRMADTDFGLGVRKVRHKAEVIHAYHNYKSLVRKLELKAAATDDPVIKQKYMQNVQMLATTLRGMVANHQEQALE